MAIVRGKDGKTLVSKERLQLFKQLQDIMNEAKFLGIHATADKATQLATARAIDGVNFDGTADITLPTKVVQVYSKPSTDPIEYYSDAGFTTQVTTFDTAKLYVDLTTNEHKHFNGTTLVAAAASDNTPRIPMSMKGAANGVAELGNDGKVPATQLPSYVDDVVEVIVETETGTGNKTFYSVTTTGTKGTAISTGEAGKIYVDINAEIDGTYRWSGTRFVEIGTKVSTADRAINDANGDQIDTTYVKVETGKSLMTDTQAQQLQTLVDNQYDEISEADVRAMFDATTLATYDAANATP